MNVFSKETRELNKTKRANWKEYKKSVKIEEKVARKLERETLKEEYADAPTLTRFLAIMQMTRGHSVYIWLVLILKTVKKMIFLITLRH